MIAQLWAIPDKALAFSDLTLYINPTMHNLFEPDVNSDIVDRLANLTPASKARWGKMNAGEMLMHLDLSLRANFGEIRLPKSWLGVFFKRMAKKILLGDKPFPRRLPAPKETLAKASADFDAEKIQVMSMIRSYAEKGGSVLGPYPHNILGKITPEESATIAYKHIDHHLRQFGL